MDANQPPLIITNPLLLWRTQQSMDEAQATPRPMTASEAARRFGTTVVTWRSWEQDLDSPEFKMPKREHMQALYLFTGGAVTADMMHGLAPYEQERAA